MTKQRLAQYTKLKREIILLESRIYSAESGGELVTDFAKDYSTGYPQVITLRGYGSQAIPKLSARKSWCLAECTAIENFVSGITDSVLHQLLDLRFIEGRTMRQAANMVGYSERQAIRLINAVFEGRQRASPDDY